MQPCKHCKQQTSNTKRVCNLCLKDIQRGRPAGTTARERGLTK